MMKRRSYGIIIMLVMLALIYSFFHFSEQYWLHLFSSSRSELPDYAKMYVYLIRGSILLSMVVLMIFYDKIFEYRKEVTLSLLAIFVTLVIIEMAAGFYLCHYADSKTQYLLLSYNQCGTEPRFAPHPYLIYQGNPKYQTEDNTHNELGFRGPEITIPKPKGRYRIVTLGGSSVYSTGVSGWKDDFARQLQSNLDDLGDIEVINGGMGGYTSWENLLTTEFKILDLDADMIVVYVGINDIQSRLVKPENYKADNSGKRKVWEVKEPPFPINFNIVKLITKTNAIGLGTFVNRDDTFPIYMEDRYYDNLGGTPSEILEINKPIYFERNVKNMIAIAQEYNITVVLSTFINNDLFKHYDSLPHYKKGLVEHNQVIRDLALEKNVPIYDFAEDPIAKNMSKDKTYWKDGVHLNEKGERLKGELFGKFIRNVVKMQKDKRSDNK